MAKRNNSHARGYGYAHQQERARWVKQIKRDGVATCHAKLCLMSSRLILDGQPWDLGHNVERTAWTGPEHPLCNRSEGSKRRHGNTPRRNSWTL